MKRHYIRRTVDLVTQGTGKEKAGQQVSKIGANPLRFKVEKKKTQSGKDTGQRPVSPTNAT